MKNILIVVLIALAVSLGVLAFVQQQKLAALKTELVSLRSESEQKAQEISDLQSFQRALEKERDELRTAPAAPPAKARDAREAKNKPAGNDSPDESDKSEKKKNPFGDFLAKMMEDPETKKMIREQQRLVLNQLYAPLIKKMNLAPDEAEQFKNLLAEQMLKGTENATSLMGGPTNRTEMLEKLAADQKEFDEQIRGFLGESRYLQYKDYQQTVGERTQLSQFQQQTAASDHPLTDQQTEALLGFMKEEKQTAATDARLPLPGETPDAATMQAMLSGEGLDKLLQTQETVNQRVYERSREILSPEQLGAFGKFQTNQLQIMRMGLNFAQKFMAPEKSTPSPPNP